MKHTVSNFRRVMQARGVQLSFAEAADVLVEAGICERVNDGVALITDSIQRSALNAAQTAFQSAIGAFHNGFGLDIYDDLVNARDAVRAVLEDL